MLEKPEVLSSVATAKAISIPQGAKVRWTCASEIAPAADGYTATLASWQETVNAAFEAQWAELANNASEPNAFCENWYLLSALKQFDAAGEVKLFILKQGDELVGLLPMAEQSRYGRWPLANVQNWLHPNAFLGAPLVKQGHEKPFWKSLLNSLDGNVGSALFAHFNGLVADGPLVAALEAVCATDRRRMAMVHREERAFLTGDLSPEAYFENAMRGKKRKELRRQKNRLSEEGMLSFARHEDDADLERWTNEFLALERAGWKGENGSALDCAGQTRNLFRAALKGAAARGKLERLDLRLDGKPLAMLVNFICTPGSFSFKTAFDESYARFSPGVLLQIENLDLLARNDLDWCDSCAAEGHPMIDSLWTGRRTIGRYSVAIGSNSRRLLFGGILRAELARGAARKPSISTNEATGDDA